MRTSEIAHHSRASLLRWKKAYGGLLPSGCTSWGGWERDCRALQARHLPDSRQEML